MNLQNETSYWIGFIMDHFGTGCFLLAVLFGCIEKIHAQVVTSKQPELRQGYDRVVLGYALILGLPWLFIVLGEFFQGYQGILYLFLSRKGNIFSWLFYITLFCEFAFLGYWLWLRAGADFLFKHPLLFFRASSPKAYKIYISLAALGGIIGSALLIGLSA